MGKPTGPARAILFGGMLSGSSALLEEAASALAGEFGPASGISETWPFDHTDYYEAESGPRLLRRFVSFAGLVGEERLAAIKLRTNEMERELARCSGALVERPVNLDPGLLRLDSVVLASTKPAGHRIYVGSGVHAEITLVYDKGAYRPLPWTYPDFRSRGHLEYFERLRDSLKAARRGAERG